MNPGDGRRRVWHNPTVVGMGLTSFLSDASHEAGTSILPVFLASIGAPPAALGVIEGVADGLSSFVKLAAGWVGDRVRRRKPIVVGGYMLTGVATGLFGLATAWPHILASRAVGWMGRGIRGPLRDAMLAEAVEPELRGRAFGFERAGDTLGAVVGPALAMALLAFLSYRQVFFTTLVPGLLAALSFGLLVRERGRPAIRPLRFGEAMGALPRHFRLFLVAVAVFGAGDFARTLLILRASQMLGPRLGALRAGEIAVALYLVHNIVYAAASYPMGALGDRLGKRGLLAAGYALSGLVCAGFIAAGPSVAQLALLFAASGLYIAVEDTLERAIAADLLPEPVRSTGYGVLAAANGAGDLVSSVVVGLLWTAVGPAAGFAYAGVLALAGALLLLLARRS